MAKDITMKIANNIQYDMKLQCVGYIAFETQIFLQ